MDKHATLPCGEQRTDLALDLGERHAELGDVSGQQPGQQGGQHEPRHARLDGVPVVEQITEKPILGIPGEPLPTKGHGEHAPPPLRQEVPSNHRADPASLAHAGLDH